MQRVLAAVLSLTVAWHAVLGCCWHHAHASTTHEHGQCGRGPAGHCHEEPGQDDHGDRHAPAPCEKSSCLFVRGEQVRSLDQVDELAFSPGLAWSPVAAIVAEATISVPEGDPPLPAVPRHLQFSVLLI